MHISERWHAFFDRPAPNIALRASVMVIGWAFVAASVALTRATGLGTSPISCMPAVLSYMTALSIGQLTFIMNCCFVLIQIALLRRAFKPIQLMQIPCVLVFSVLIDLFVPLCNLLPMPSYPTQLIWSIVGCFMTAFGVFLQVKASLFTQPGEGVVLAVSKVTRVAFPKCKVAFDSTMVASSSLISLVAMGGLFGVREGTIISAIFVGVITGVYNKALPHFERFCPIKGHPTFTAAGMDVEDRAETTSGMQPEVGVPSEPPLVIAISRQYGSGGREIGHLVGDALSIPVFDSSLIALTAEESGLTPAYVAAHEEEVRRGVLYDLVLQNYQYIGQDPTEEDELWLAQARTITRIADSGACVIVGRCAGAILSERDNVFSVFVHAPLEPRVKRVMTRDNVNRTEAVAKIERIDAERAAHCRRYTGKPWDAMDTYSLSIDSSLARPQDTAHMICAIAQAAYPQAPLTPAPK